VSVCLGLLVGIAACSNSDSSAPELSASKNRTLEGKILEIKDDNIVLEDREDAVVQFKVGSDTLMKEKVTPGDQITATIGEEGNTITITKKPKTSSQSSSH